MSSLLKDAYVVLVVFCKMLCVKQYVYPPSSSLPALPPHRHGRPTSGRRPDQFHGAGFLFDIVKYTFDDRPSEGCRDLNFHVNKSIVCSL